MKSKLRIIMLACITLIPPSQCTGQAVPTATPASQQVNKYVEQGDVYFNQGGYDKAIDEYTKAIASDPKLAVAYWSRGRVYHFVKNLYSKAVDDYSKAIELDTKYTRAYYYRGLANAANGGYDRALSDFTKTIELDPSLSMAYNVRAWCYAHKAQWDQSSQLYLYQLFESDSGLADAYKGRGWVYVRQMQWELFAVPDLVRAADTGTTKSEDSSISLSNIDTVGIGKSKYPGAPYVKVAPASGPVGTKLFIYGWGFRGNEDGISITWDGELVTYNIRAEPDGGLMVDGSKVTHMSSSYTGDTREAFYVPPTTQGRHVLGVYGSSFTPKGIVNDTIFDVTPEIKLVTEPSIKGTQVTINGAGFASSEIVTISLDKAATNTTATADKNGSFTTVLEIPTSKGREYTVAASGNKGNSAQVSFGVASEKSVSTDQGPVIAEVYCNRGFAHFKKAQWALAIADLDRAYARDPALNRSSWNKDWALSKKAQWDAVIIDYQKVIEIASRQTSPPLSPGTLQEELALAVADYNKALGLSQDPALIQKAKGALKFIDEWNKGIDK